MRILIVGGWKKADFIAKSLTDKKHELIIIHDNFEYCKWLSRKYNIPVICGDGSDPDILEEANIKEFDIVLALTPKDEDNLAICKIAKENFFIKKAFSIVGNPKNVDIFKKFGVDNVISSTYVVSNIIEQVATVKEIENYIPLDNGQVGLMEILLKKEYFLSNKIISEISFPKKAIIVCIIRGINTIIPKGDTRLMSLDKLVILSPPQEQTKVIEFITRGSEKN